VEANLFGFCDFSILCMHMKNFKEKVLDVVKKIPKGKTITYKEVAKQAGNPLAFRAVGSLMAKNFDKTIPCHRVIKSDGTFGNYNRGGVKNKIKILRKEGAIK
jgi:O-6-methylguanine DNA methyltransferase